MTVAVALQRPKTKENVGAILRLAQCWGVSLVAIVGKQRFPLKHPLNTMSAEREIPVMHFDDMSSLADAWGSHFTPIGVELTPASEDIRGFVHPRSALYLFGPEDGDLNTTPIRCRHTIQIPTRRCLNLAHAVGITLYDRSTKGAL